MSMFIMLVFLSPQVQGQDGLWEDVPSDEDSFLTMGDSKESRNSCSVILTVGAMLERATAGALKAVRYRIKPGKLDYLIKKME